VDTLGSRRAWNADANCIANPDTMELPKDKYWVKDVVTSQGLVPFVNGKTLLDIGVGTITSTSVDPGFGAPVYYLSPLGHFSRNSNSYSSYPVPTVVGKTIKVRDTWALGDFETYTARCNGVNQHEYVGRVFIRSLSNASSRGSTIYWHGALNFGNDPYHQWLFGDILAKHFKYYNKIIKSEL
jgi:hypothetical protein